jgi:hypothetical protein
VQALERPRPEDGAWTALGRPLSWEKAMLSNWRPQQQQQHTEHTPSAAQCANLNLTPHQHHQTEHDGGKATT